VGLRHVGDEGKDPPRPRMQKRERRGLARSGRRLFHDWLAALWDLGDRKLDLVAFIQGLVAGRVANRVMDEDIRPILLRDKAKALSALNHFTVRSPWGDPPGMDGKKPPHRSGGS